MKRTQLLLTALGLELLTMAGCAFMSCEDKMAQHYEEPAYLQGSISQILEKEGNYTLFLQGVDMCDWRRILDGKSNMTVMAPNDSAMNAYLVGHMERRISLRCLWMK